MVLGLTGPCRYTHSHTRSHKYAHTYDTHVNTHTSTHLCTHSHDTQTFTNLLTTQTHTHNQTQTLKHTQIKAITQTHPNSHKPTLTYTLYSRPLPLLHPTHTSKHTRTHTQKPRSHAEFGPPSESHRQRTKYSAGRRGTILPAAASLKGMQ